MGCPEACPAVGKAMEDWGIDDPSGGYIEGYRKVRDVITQKVKRLLETLAAKSEYRALTESISPVSTTDESEQE